MISSWPEYRGDWEYAQAAEEVELMKEAVRGIRNVRTQLNVPPSKKASVYVVSENADIRRTFEDGKVFFATLAKASEVFIQENREGIGEDAVSAMVPGANIYIPFAELVDIDKELERLEKEKERLTKEIARSDGMLKNERFVSKAPADKVQAERDKLTKYTQMMEQVETRLAQLKK